MMNDHFIRAGKKRRNDATLGYSIVTLPILEELTPLRARMCPFFKASGACLFHPGGADISF
mgnify:CR=1 FL=1|jgi:hypothetical protein